MTRGRAFLKGLGRASESSESLLPRDGGVTLYSIAGIPNWFDWGAPKKEKTGQHNVNSGFDQIISSGRGKCKGKGKVKEDMHLQSAICICFCRPMPCPSPTYITNKRSQWQGLILERGALRSRARRDRKEKPHPKFCQAYFRTSRSTPSAPSQIFAKKKSDQIAIFFSV